jgi:2-polyprenyl-3-methyl-5-hydroxy-6-metoxy-1,4-benzoquinol methylase
MPTTEFRSGFYDQFHATQNYMAKKEKKIRKSRRRIRRSRKFASGREFLDVGCNVGLTVEAARLEGSSASGIDIDPHAISLAQREFPKPSFHAATAEEFRNSGKTFDVVYCSEVIEHLTEVRSFVGTLAALTRTDGLLYLTTPDAGHYRTPSNFIEWEAVKPPQHLCWFSRKNLRMLFERFGFTIVKFSFNIKLGIKMLARKV